MAYLRRERQEIPGGLNAAEKELVQQMTTVTKEFKAYLQPKLDKVMGGTELTAEEKAELSSKSDAEYAALAPLKSRLNRSLIDRGFHLGDAWQYTPEYNELSREATAMEHAILEPSERGEFIRSTETRDIPNGSTDAISYEDIKEGDEMIDFDGEYGYGRYYTKNTFKSLGKNPYTRQPFRTPAAPYKAHLVAAPPGGRRRKTRKHSKKTRKTRKTRSRR